MSLAAALALAALVQAAQPPAAPPVPDAGRVTVIERTAEELADIPLNSRIARVNHDNVADDPAAAMFLREWADCVVRIYRPRTLALLATPLNSPEQAALVNQLTGHRFTRRTICARFRSMRVDNVVLRGAIAEALWRWEERRQRSAGPLAPAPAPTGEDSPARLALMGRCVVDRDAEGVARVMTTRPGTGASQRAVARLNEPITACMPADLRRQGAHPFALRGALGEPFYLSRRGRVAARAEASDSDDAAAATPSR